MNRLVWAYLADGVAVGLGLVLARRRPQHRPVAVLLCLGLSSDIASLLLPLPFPAAVVAGCVYPWAVVWTVLVVLHGAPQQWSGRWVGAWFGLWLSAILGSGVRGHALASVYTATQIGVAVSLAALVGAWWRRTTPRRPDATEAVVLAAAATEVWNAFGPWWWPPTTWPLARVAYTGFYVLAVLLQLGGIHGRRSLLVLPRRDPSPPSARRVADRIHHTGQAARPASR